MKNLNDKQSWKIVNLSFSVTREKIVEHSVRHESFRLVRHKNASILGVAYIRFVTT